MRRRLLAMFTAAAMGCGGSKAPDFVSGRDAGGATDVAFSTPDGWNLQRDAIVVADRGPVVISGDAACSTSTADGRRVPTNILILLDRSGSMNERGKWQAAVSGISTLLTRLTDDARVGITFFPAARNPGDVSGYVQPAVPVAPLRTNRSTLLTVLRSTTANGNTPMVCGINGVSQYYRDYREDGARNVILITDGVPTEECAQDLPACNIFDFACLLGREPLIQNQVRVAVARAAMAMPPLRLYVAGTPEASDTFLSDLAVIGGTPRTPDCRGSMTCHYRLQTASFESDLTMALQDIQARSLTCEFEVDADPSRVDPDRVNVNIQGMGMSSPRLIPRDVDHREGWDYTEGRRSIVVYGSGCDQIRNDTQVRVQIVFGCPTVTPG